MRQSTLTAKSPDVFDTVSELAGEPVSAEQIDRMYHRYLWATEYARGKDVAEIACGSGPGLGLLGETAHSFVAGDLSPGILKRAERHYGSRVRLEVFGAEQLPYADASKDVLILFEAIYYLRDTERFLQECRRVLRPSGVVLIATANKDLDDFNPSPYSHTYYGVLELQALFGRHGFSCRFFGYLAVRSLSLRQRVLRPVKRAVVNLGLMPRTMAGKKFLKRLVFGPQHPMPAELTREMGVYNPPVPLEAGRPDRHHKVVYCIASLDG